MIAGCKKKTAGFLLILRKMEYKPAMNKERLGTQDNIDINERALYELLCVELY